MTTPTPSNNNAPMEKVHQEALNMLLLDAIQHGNIERVQLAAAKGADLDASAHHAEWKGKQGYIRPALHFAYEVNNIKVLEIMLAAGAKVDIKDADGQTVMMRAAQNKNAATVRLCLKYKANPLVKDNAGKALLSAARSTYSNTGEDAAGKEVIEALLNALPTVRAQFDAVAPKQPTPDVDTQTVTFMPQIRLKKPAKAGGPDGFNLE